jgi:hypothetical protein
MNWKQKPSVTDTVWFGGLWAKLWMPPNYVWSGEGTLDLPEPLTPFLFLFIYLFFWCHWDLNSGLWVLALARKELCHSASSPFLICSNVIKIIDWVDFKIPLYAHINPKNFNFQFPYIAAFSQPVVSRVCRNTNWSQVDTYLLTKNKGNFPTIGSINAQIGHLLGILRNSIGDWPLRPLLDFEMLWADESLCSHSAHMSCFFQVHSRLL